MDLKTAALKLNDADATIRDAAMAAVVQARGGAVGPLVEALDVPGAPVAKIALLLAALTARAGVAPLAGLVNRGLLDAETRAVVARALAALVEVRDATNGSVHRAVIGLSRDAFAATRTFAASALGRLGDPACEARLGELTRGDADPAVQAAAASALQGLRAHRAPAAPAIEEGGLQVDLEALVAARVASAPGPGPDRGPHGALVARLRDLRWSVRNAAVDEVVAQAASARAQMIPLLLELLAEPHVGGRLGAVQALARIQAPEAAPALLEVITKAGAGSPQAGQDNELRAIALKALAASLTGAEEGYAPALVPLIKDPDPFVRAGALLCLGRLADRAGARAAALGLGDTHEHVREAAAVALSEGVREDDSDLVLPLLARLAAMPSPSVAAREAILLALARIHVEEPAVVLRVRHRVRREVLGVTSSLRRTAITILERSYSQDDPPPIQVVDDVLGRLGDDHPEVRLLAASFLAQHLTPGLAGAVEALEDALDRGERALSLVALDALRRHDTAKARRALEAACSDTDAEVAARAALLVAGFTPTAEEWRADERGASAVDAGRASSAPAGAAVTAGPGEPPAPRPRRVRPAVNAAADVVEAREPGAVPGGGTTSTP